MTMKYIRNSFCEIVAECREISRISVNCTKIAYSAGSKKNHFGGHPSQNAFMQGLFHNKPY
jgi:hypothetical protein